LKGIKVPVRLCNITANPILIKPNSELCVVNEVKVVDDLSTHLTADSCNPNQLDVDSDTCFVDGLGLTIDETDLTPEQLLRVRQVLGKWQLVFKTGANDIGKVTSVKHKIVLTDETPFKMPYRKIPPGMYEEVRQH